jgi:membrane fusion protein (multidrug efflux system)
MKLIFPVFLIILLSYQRGDTLGAARYFYLNWVIGSRRDEKSLDINFLDRSLNLISNTFKTHSQEDWSLVENDQRARAQVLAAKAQLQIAELNLGYTEIHAPIKGRIGLTTYTIGNLVGPGSGVLATIVNQDPIYVTFPVSTRVILGVREQAVATGKSDVVVVRAQLPDGKMYQHPGKVNFLNIQADQTTDTIVVRAQFPNPEGFLVDGEFVNVTVEQEKPDEALLVPQSAMQTDQGGSYVLLVNAQDEVEVRRIEVGQSYGTSIVATSGLKAGDRVIVEGIQKVRPGVKVQATVIPPQPVQPLTPPAATPSAAGGAATSDQTAPPASSAPAADPPASGSAPAADPPAAPAATPDKSSDQAPAAAAPAN